MGRLVQVPLELVERVIAARKALAACGYYNWATGDVTGDWGESMAELVAAKAALIDACVDAANAEKAMSNE